MKTTIEESKLLYSLQTYSNELRMKENADKDIATQKNSRLLRDIDLHKNCCLAHPQMHQVKRHYKCLFWLLRVNSSLNRGRHTHSPDAQNSNPQGLWKKNSQ